MKELAGSRRASRRGTRRTEFDENDFDDELDGSFEEEDDAGYRSTAATTTWRKPRQMKSTKTLKLNDGAPSIPLRLCQHSPLPLGEGLG